MFNRMALGLMLGCSPAWLAATNYQWNTGDGVWSDSTAWTPTGIPNNTSDRALIGAPSSEEFVEVTLDLPVSLQSLELNSGAVDTFDIRISRASASDTLTISQQVLTGRDQTRCAAELILPNDVTFQVEESLAVNKISGPGGLRLTGGGRLRLAGEGVDLSSYTGITLIEQGAYEAAVYLTQTFPLSSAFVIADDPDAQIIVQTTTQTIASLSGGGPRGGNVYLGTGSEPGYLTVGDSTDATYAGRILRAFSDGPASGTLTKQGSGTWTLAGNNTHVGGTFLNEGTLVAAHPNALGSGTLTMADGTTLGIRNGVRLPNSIALPPGGEVAFQVDSGRAVLMGSIATVAADFEKTGSGTLVIEENWGVTGTGTVTEGSLIVRSTCSPCQFHCAPGALLGGIGTIGATTVQGTLRPGASIGWLLGSSCTMQTGSRMEVEVDGLGSASAYYLTGSFTIEPGVTFHVDPRRGSYADTTFYNVVEADLILGFFDALEVGPRWTASLSYDPTTIQLSVSPFYYRDVLEAAGFCCCPLQATARYLDCLYYSDEQVSDDLEHLFDILNAATPCQLASAAVQLGPDSYTIQPIAQQYTTLQVLQGMVDRLDQRRTLATAPWASRTAHVWVTPTGLQAHQSADEGWQGYDAYDMGVLVGTDLQGSHWQAGAAFSYSSLHLQELGDRIRSSEQSFYGHLYGRWSAEHLFADLILGGAYNLNQLSRGIGFQSSAGSILREACSSFAGNQFDLYAGIGANGSWHGIDLAAIASVDWIRQHQDSTLEEGANALNLKVDSYSVQLVRGELSLWLSKLIGSSLPQLGVAVAYDWRPTEGLKSRFREVCTLFCADCADGWAPNRLLLLPRAKWTQLLSERYSIALAYEGQFASQYSQNSLWLELGYAF
jgi:autotransporter-associated beta strand protein